MHKTLGFITAASLLMTSAAARAEDVTTHDVAITLSPIHLTLPVVELQGEFKLTPYMSASAIIGFGTASDANNIIEATVFELGAQYTYYLVGDFDHGMQLGAEALFVYLTDSEAAPGGVFGGGFSVGPYIGYKVAADFGLTFMAQLGVAFMAVAAASEERSASEKSVSPLLNINLGWSF